jgi:hypothetical protein
MKKCIILFVLFTFLIRGAFGEDATLAPTKTPSKTKSAPTPEPSPTPDLFNSNLINLRNSFFSKFSNGILVNQKIEKGVTVVNVESNPNFNIYSPVDDLVVGYYETDANGNTQTVSKNLDPNLYLHTPKFNTPHYFTKTKSQNFNFTGEKLEDTKDTPANFKTFSFDISKAVEARGQTTTACVYNLGELSNHGSVTIQIGKVETFSHGFVLTQSVKSFANIQGGVTYVDSANWDITPQVTSPVGIYYGIEVFLVPRCFDYENEIIDNDTLNIFSLRHWNIIAGINVQAPTNGFLLGFEGEFVKRIPIVIAWTPSQYYTLSNGEYLGEPVTTGTNIAVDQKMDWSNFSVGVDLYPLIGQTLLSALGTGISTILGTGNPPPGSNMQAGPASQTGPGGHGQGG